jgi:2,3-dihydroxybenzoate decarboxylase
MDEAGVDMQILSLATPGVQDFSTEDAVELARVANDRLSELIRQSPSRYSGLAVFPPQAPREAAKELERAAQKLKLKGAVVHSHTRGEYLDDPKYWAIFEALESLGLPLYLHPRGPAPTLAGPAMNIKGFRVGWSFGVETGTHALRLIASGVFDRFPNLRIILGHMGEMLPFFMPRIDQRYRIEAEFRGSSPIKRLPGEYFAENFFVTTSGLNEWPQLRMTIETHGVQNIMFAIDYPFEDMREAVESIQSMPLSDDDRRRICETNALRVFGIRGESQASDGLSLRLGMKIPLRGA